MSIFKDKKNKTVVAAAPEEAESPEEIKHIEELSGNTEEKNEMSYREIPVCMSQEQINNIVIENNIMLKQIIAELD